MIEQLHSEAFVLSSVPHGETNRVISLFTKELGIVPAYLKEKSASWLQPLSCIQAMLTPGKGDLYLLKEATLLDPFLSLRDHFPRLKTAMHMTDFIKKFLPEHVDKPHIYQLLKVYIQKLKETEHPENYLFSLILKTLHAEGVLEIGQTIQSEEVEWPLYLTPLITARKFEDIERIVIHDCDKELFYQSEF